MKSLLGKLGVILIGVLILGSAEVWGEDWKLYGGNEYYVGFYDTQSITRLSENVVRVWVRMDYTEKGVLDWLGNFGEKYKNLSHSITLWEINCADKKFHFLSSTYYSKEEKVIYSWKVLYSSGSSEEWSHFITGSLGERLFKEVCK